MIVLLYFFWAKSAVVNGIIFAVPFFCEFGPDDGPF